MAAATVSDAEFISLWNKHQSASAVARELGIWERAVHSRRKRIEAKEGIKLHSTDPRGALAKSAQNPSRLTLSLPDGVVIVGSDAHAWPGPLTTAQRAFIHYCKKLKPDLVVMNGDVFDGARVSRHPSGIWEHEARPNIRQELDACKSFLGDVSKASGPAKKVWLWGNHDQRYEYRLSAMTPEYEGVAGFALKDHFPEWTMGMSLWVNDVVIKHRWHNGIHATYNNALKGGKSIVTGHLHSLQVRPWTDYTGTRYGVDTGTLADPDSAQFNYTEDAARNWRPGFVVLTFHKGRLLVPEIAQVSGDAVEFRGKVEKV